MGLATPIASSQNVAYPTVGEILGLGGFVCGAVQLAEDGHVGRKNGLLVEVVPSPDGIGVAGAF